MFICVLFVFFVYRCVFDGFLFILFFFFFSSRRRHTRCLSDWSSDVCSSDLGGVGRTIPSLPRSSPRRARTQAVCPRRARAAGRWRPRPTRARGPRRATKIGRASCRERVEISGGAGTLKTKREETANKGSTSR